MRDLEELYRGRTDAEVFGIWAATIRELRARGLIWSERNPLADYAEWLVARCYGVEPVRGSNPGYDIECEDRTTVQVKARRYTSTNKPGHFGDFGNLEQELFDDFVGVLFEEDMSVRTALLLPHRRVVELAIPVVGKQRLTISALLNAGDAIELDLSE